MRSRFQFSETYQEVSNEDEVNERDNTSDASTLSVTTGIEPGIEFSWEIARKKNAVIQLSYPLYAERIWWLDSSNFNRTTFQPTYGRISFGIAF